METFKEQVALMKAPSKYNSFTKLLYLLYFLVSIILSLMISLRGLDLTDESLYILSAAYPQDQSNGLTLSHFLIAPLWLVTNQIVMFRLSAILVSLLVSIVLTAQIKKFVNNRILIPNVYIVLIIWSTYLSYGMLLNFSPSYNLMIAWAVPITFFEIISFIRGNHRSVIVKNFLLANLGLVCVTNTKFTVLFALLGYIFVSETFLFPKERSRTIRRLLVLLVGLMSSLLVEYFALKFYRFNFRYFTDGILALRDIQSEGSFAHLLVVLLRTGRRIFISLIFILGLLSIKYLTRTKSKLARNSLYVAYSVPFVLKFKLYYASNANWTGPATAIHCIIIIYLISYRRHLFNDPVSKSLTLSLFLLPYIMSFGTNNIYFEQTLFYLSPWVILLLVGSNDTKVNFSNSLLSFFTLTTTTLLITSFFTPSYGQVHSYYSNNAKTSLKSYGVLYLNPADSKMVRNLQHMKEDCAITNKDRFLGLSNLGGIAIPLELRPLGNPWITTRMQAEMNLALLDESEKIVMAIREPVDGSQEFIPESLNFPDNFRSCGRVLMSDGRFIQIWVAR